MPKLSLSRKEIRASIQFLWMLEICGGQLAVWIAGAFCLTLESPGQITHPRRLTDRLDSIAFAGAQHDPVAALVFCQPLSVELSLINGQIVVKEGQLVTSDLPVLIEQHNALSLSLVRDN